MTTKEQPQNQFILNDDITFPAILNPNHNTTSSLQLTEAVKSNKQYIQSLLDGTGAVLFRGFGVDTSVEFNEVVVCFGYEDFVYGAEGAGSRTKICGRVYTANESPPEQMIGFHHELSHANEFPTKLFFFCEVEPGSGGETCIAMAMCLGYVNEDQCVVCIKTAIPLLRQKCPNQKEAVAWMQKCMIHYSVTFKEFDPWFWAFLGDKTKVPENEVLLFEQKKGNLMLELSGKAAKINQAPKYSTDAVAFGSKTTNQTLKYSTGTAAFGSKTIYMAMQCSPYLLQDTCNQCFLTIHFTIGVATKGDVAYAMFSPYCYMKYALYDFRK